MTYHAKVIAGGKIVIPADLRRELGIRDGDTLVVDRTDDEVSICAEIMAESRRHPDIRQLYQTIENDIRERVAALLQRAAERNEIRSDLDPQAVAGLLMAIGDGMSWRRSVDPKFSAEESLPLILNMVHGLLAAPKKDAGSDGAKS